MKLLLVFLLSFIVTLSEGSNAFAEPEFNDIPPSPTLIPLKDSLGLRLGFMASALIGSNQGRPFFYFDTGLRFKNNSAYFDLRLPAFIGGLDYLFYYFQEEILGVRSAFNFFEGINSPLQYGAYIEPIMFRLGQTFTVFPFDDESPLRLTAGIGFVAEFVFFDLALFSGDLEEFDPREDPNSADPIIAAPGGFIALGGDFPSGEYDIAIGGGPDVFVDSAYSPNSGAVIYLDADVQYDVGEDVGISLRARVSTYTHTEEMAFTAVINGGVIVRLY